MDFKNSTPENHRKNIVKDILVTITLLGIATLSSFALFYAFDYLGPNIALIYILALIIIGRYTTGYIPGIIASIVGVVCVNYLFTYPFFALNFTITGYPITFIVMLTVSIITSASTANLKKQGIALAEKEKIIAEGEKEKMRATLLRSISHDLRTPLTGIIGASSSLTNQDLDLSDKEKMQLLTNINEDANWLLNMVENILSVTKIQGETATLKKTPEALEEVMSDSVLRIKKRIPDADITTTLPQEFILVPMDGLLIEQVIINLLENALIHSHSQKPIELYCSIQKNTITIHIKDYGIGLQCDNPDELFTLYSGRSAEHSDSEKGFGIGLSICKTIIHAHGGEINAVKHNDGTEFYFTLPKED